MATLAGANMFSSMRRQRRLMVSVGNDENANPNEKIDSAVEMGKVVDGHSAGEQNAHRAEA